MTKSQLKNIIKECIQEVLTGDDWGTPEEILNDLDLTMKSEIELPLTKLIDVAEVKQLLAPIYSKLADLRGTVQDTR